MQESYEHEISFIDLGGRLRICQHLQLLAIRLVFIIKRLLIVPIFNIYIPFVINYNINNIINDNNRLIILHIER
jgi:hypothetical protein